jgi:hypothetical protein
MPRILLALIALVATLALAAGCGSDDSTSSGAATLAPAGALIYAEATLQPEGDQKAAVESLIEKVPGEGDAGERIQRLMEDAFAGSGLAYAKDVEPWLGDEAGFFLSALGPNGDDATGAALVATDDEGKTEDAIEKAAKAEGGRKASYDGNDYYAFGDDDTAAGVVEGWLVVGNEAGFKAAVDAAGGESLDGDDRYQEALDDAASEERLGFLYLNSPAFLDQLRKSGAGAALGQFEQFFRDPFLATVDADSDGIRLEAVVPESLATAFPVVAEGSGMAGELPADAWLAVAQPDLGKTVEQILDFFAAQLGGRDAIAQQLKQATGLDLEQDVISWMGDWALFVRGTTVRELGGALVIETSDEAASARAINAVVRLARRAAEDGEKVVPLTIPGGGEGATLRSPDVPEPIHLFQRDGKVVLAYGDAAAEDALDPAEKLADSDPYAEAERALGGDYALSFYLAVDPILELVDSTGAASDDDWQQVRAYLEPLGALVGGATKDGGDLRSAIGLSVK